MSNVPHELKTYSDMLRIADRIYRAAERTKPGKRPIRSKMMFIPALWRKYDTRGIKFQKAEQAYDKALEFLDENWQPIVHLLDRSFMGLSGSDAFPDPDSVPRAINSKSPYRRDR